MSVFHKALVLSVAALQEYPWLPKDLDTKKENMNKNADGYLTNIIVPYTLQVSQRVFVLEVF
jgi:hypothetical protein